jgi:hypothetical protein
VSERIERESQLAIASRSERLGRLERQVFNPNPWPVQSLIEVYHAPVTTGIESISFHADDGAELPSQTLRQLRHPRFGGSINDQLSLVRMELPAFGYRTIRTEERTEALPTEEPTSTSTSLVTDDLILEFRDHALWSVTDRGSGHQVADASNRSLPGLTFHEVGQDGWVHDGPELSSSRYVANESSWIERGPLRWRHRSRGTVGPFAAEVDLIVPHTGREIEVQVRLEGHWDRAPQTGWLSLLMPVPLDSTIHVDVPFGVEERHPDTELYHGNLPPEMDSPEFGMFERLRPGWFWARSWADFRQAGSGISMLSLNGNYYWQKTGTEAGPVLMRLINPERDSWQERAPKEITGSGSHQFSYVITLQDGHFSLDDLQRRASEWHFQPSVQRGEPTRPQTLPTQHEFLRVEGSANVSAMYVEDDHLYVRVWEAVGDDSPIRLHFGSTVTEASLVNLAGEPLPEPVEVGLQEIGVTLRKWQIATVRVQFATDASCSG